MKCWTCIKYIVLQKGLTRVGFYQGIDNLGKMRYIIHTDEYGKIGISAETSKEEGNSLFSQLISEGYTKYWEKASAL